MPADTPKILGSLSIICTILAGWVGIWLAVVGLVLAIISRSMGEKILGLIALIISGVMIIVILVNTYYFVPIASLR